MEEKGTIIWRGEKSFQRKAKMSQAVERHVNYCPNVVSLKNFKVEIGILIMGLLKTNSLQLAVQQLYLSTSVFKTKT